MQSSGFWTRDFPSVMDALRWLLATDRSVDDRTMLLRARLRGLVSLKPGSHWDADGAMVRRLTCIALRKLPQNAAELGNILHGLGEISARSHANLLATPLIERLARLRHRLSWQAVLDAANERDKTKSTQVSLNTLAFTQWIARAPMGWQTFDHAAHCLSYPNWHGGGRYGLEFTAKIVLAICPKAVDAWIETHTDSSAVAVIGGAAASMQLQKVRVTVSLLSSRTPALRSLAAVALVYPGIPDEPMLEFRNCWRALTGGGISEGDATWMMGLRLKESVHARYRAEQNLERGHARLRHLEKSPEAANGGAKYAAAEIRSLRHQITHENTRVGRLTEDLEATLSDLAAIWPSAGLSTDQMKNLEPVFVDTPEIRYRLAEKLTHKYNRDILFKTNINQLKILIGLDQAPIDAFQEYFDHDENRFAQIAHWTTLSVISLYTKDNRGVGKRTSDLVDKFVRTAEELFGQPFIAARKPAMWRSAAIRVALALRFVLLVVANAQAQPRTDVTKLRELAVEHSFILLGRVGSRLPSERAFVSLTAEIVAMTNRLPDPDGERTKWAYASVLPVFARALALWSSPALVEHHDDLARTLFYCVAEPPLSRTCRDLQMSRMLTLLDTAIASAASAKKPHLIISVQNIWESIYAKWSSITDQWAGAARMLATAVVEEGPDREALLADPNFTNSYCRQLINARTE
jgi:hypothetical protein